MCHIRTVFLLLEQCGECTIPLLLGPDSVGERFWGQGALLDSTVSETGLILDTGTVLENCSRGDAILTGESSDHEERQTRRLFISWPVLYISSVSMVEFLHIATRVQLYLRVPYLRSNACLLSRE